MASGDDGALSDNSRSTGCRLGCRVAKGLEVCVDRGRREAAVVDEEELPAAGLPREEICTVVGLLRPPDTQTVWCMC
jgi:hypothetical protein